MLVCGLFRWGGVGRATCSSVVFVLLLYYIQYTYRITSYCESKSICPFNIGLTFIVRCCCCCRGCGMHAFVCGNRDNDNDGDHHCDGPAASPTRRPSLRWCCSCVVGSHFLCVSVLRQPRRRRASFLGAESVFVCGMLCSSFVILQFAGKCFTLPSSNVSSMNTTHIANGYETKVFFLVARSY